MSIRKFYRYMAIFFITFLTIATVYVKAHQPVDMLLNYNSSTNTLTVSITHTVSDNTTHYVNSVVVSVNGSVDQNHVYTSQPDLVNFVYIYTVVTNNGSTIRVTASCNQGGSITKTLGGTTEHGDAIPGYTGLVFVLLVSVITLLTIMRKKLKNVFIKSKN